MPSTRLIEVPSDISDQMACQMSLNPLTAWALLRDSHTGSGDWILVTPATSTVSNIVGAIARKRGIKVIGLVRGDAAATKSRCTADYVLRQTRQLSPPILPKSQEGTELRLCSIAWADH